MSQKSALLVGEIHPQALSLLKKNTILTKKTQDEFEKLSLSGDYEILIIRTFTKISERELDKFPNLKYIVSCSVGIDNINLEELKKRDIYLIYCSGTNANSVAEHALYLILSLLRNTKPPFIELKNKTVGIIGFGNIGKLVARKLSGFEVNLIAFDIIEQDKNILRELKVEMKDLDYLVENSDIITLHVNLNDNTRFMINEKIFSKMKDNVFLINTSRVEIMEEISLIKYSNLGKFKGIALDVYSENLEKNLKGNTILTPHVASQGQDSFREMCTKPIHELLKILG